MNDKLASLYPAHLDTVKQRYDAALAAAGFDRVVVFSNAERMAFLDDMPYPFKVNPHFKGWLPVTENPNSFIVYEPGRKPLLVYNQPVDYWYKRAGAPEGYWVSSFDIRPVGSLDEAKALVPGGARTAFLGEMAEEIEPWGIGNVNPQGLVDRLHYARARKTPYEVECLREANRIAARGHVAAERAFRSGASEWEIHQEYMRATSHNEWQLPYGNIVALNENSATLHYQQQERQRPGATRSFLIDAGATFLGYASDITRTYSSANDEFQALIDAMDAGQQELCAAVRPGVSYPDIHMMAHRKVAEILQRFSFVRLEAEEILSRGITRSFFPHGVGHYLGLQVHDVGGFLKSETGETIPKPEGHPYLRLTRTIEEGQVFTIEPGFYFIDPLLEELRKSDNASVVNWEKVDAFRPFGGIRVEDDLAVTADGSENLTRPAFLPPNA